MEKCGAKCAGVVKVRGANPCSDVAVLVTDAVHASHAVADLLRELLPLGSVILKSTTLYSRVFSCQKKRIFFCNNHAIRPVFIAWIVAAAAFVVNFANLKHKTDLKNFFFFPSYF